MNADSHRFTLGTFECTAVIDGTHTYSPPTFPPPARLLFSNAPEERLQDRLRRHGLDLSRWTEWVSPYICLVVDTGEHKVLVDTGAGDLAPSTGRILPNLRAAGVAPQDIDTVIITHGHPDHLGGLTDIGGTLTFPRARYFMQRDEWDFWVSGQAEAELDEHSREVLVGFARKNLPPIEERLELVDPETGIVPGIRALAAPGHTPGHMALAVSSAEERLLCISDLVLHPIHMEEPEWCAAVDFDPEQVVTTRRRILAMAATEGALVLAFHLPFPGLGHVVECAQNWEWKPIETAI